MVENSWVLDPIRWRDPSKWGFTFECDTVSVADKLLIYHKNVPSPREVCDRCDTG